MGPPCPRCGWTLTWYAQSSSWGCDRERISFSPQQVQGASAIPPAAQPFPQPMQPQPVAMPPPMGRQGAGPSQPPPMMQPPMPQPVQQPWQPPAPAQSPVPAIPKTIPISTFQQQQPNTFQPPQPNTFQPPQPNTFQPPQPMPNAGYPQAGAGFGPNLPPPAMAPAPAAKGMNKMLLLAGGGVVVVAGIAIALVMTRDAGPRVSIGVASRDKLVRMTFKSLGDGDVDGIMKRSGTPGLKKYATCDKDEAPSAEAEASEVEEARKKVESAVARLKGSTITVTKITPDTKPTILAKGEELGRGCKLDMPLEMHEVNVDIDIEHANGHLDKQTVELAVATIDGQWITDGTPHIPGCVGAIATIATTSVNELRVADAVNKLQPVLLSRCLQDEWSPTVIKCLEGAPNMAEVRKCLSTLTPKELAPLTKEVDTALANATGAGKELRALIPDPVEDKPAVAAAGSGAGPSPVDPDAALVDDTLVPDPAPPDPIGDDPGRPEEAEQADFWLWTRSDGSVRVTSPIVKAIFPARPDQKLEKGSKKTLDGKDIWLYQFTHDLGNDGQLRLEVSALGRNASDSGKDPLVAMMAKIGKVKRKKQVVDGVSITDYEVVETATGGVLRAHVIRDMPRGLMIIGLAATSTKNRAVGTKFLTSIEQVRGADPTQDDATLADIATRKAGKKYIAATPSGDFSVELPWEGTYSRTGPSAGKSLVTGVLVAEKKKSSITLQITEHASWDALQFNPLRQEELANEMKVALEKQTGTAMKMTPGRLAGVTGFAVDQVASEKPKVEFRLLWNRYQHRAITLLCIDADCDAVVDSIKFAPPTAE